MKVILRKITNKKVTYDLTQLATSINWSGSRTQASRKLEIRLAYSPFDPNFKNIQIDLGDIVYFYQDGAKKPIFTGKVLSTSQGAGPGELNLSASDFMSTLLKSKISRRFENKKPEEIAKAILDELGVEKGSIAKTGIKLKKMIFDNETAYNAIVKSYYKAFKKNRKKYKPYMDGIKFCIGESGRDSGITLKLGTNVTGTSLERSAEDIVNRVVVFNENGKKIGTFRNKESERNFGICQETVKLSSGETASSVANATLKAPTKEAKVDALGSFSCIAGRTVKLFDNQTGLWGKFFIENDTHSISNGLHTMSLELAFSNAMEGQEIRRPKPEATDKSVCWYSTGGKKYHANKTCGGLKNAVKTTVREAVKTGRGKCSICWE